MLLDRVKRLNNFNIDIIGMTCNTAHLLYPVLSENSKAHFVSMIDLVSKNAAKKGLKKVGLFTTPTTVRSNLYKNSLSKLGVEVVYPDLEVQNHLEEIVRQLVAGQTSPSQSDYLLKTAQTFSKTKHIDGLILGCTELPLVFPKDKFEVIDCLDILANHLLNVTI